VNRVSQCKNRALVLFIAAISCFSSAKKGNTVNTKDVAITIVSLKDGDTLDLFAGFSFEFEIVNNSDKTIVFHSERDIVVSIGDTYKRSPGVPVTAKELLNSKFLKMRHVPPEPVVIEAGTRQTFTFKTYNTLPLLQPGKIELNVTATQANATSYSSNSIGLHISDYVVESSHQVILDKQTNACLNPCIISHGGKRSVAVYYSEYPVFDSIPTYTQNSTGPNYESLCALLPCPKKVDKVLAVTTHTKYAALPHVALLAGRLVTIYKFLSFGPTILSKPRAIVSAKIPGSDEIEKVVRFSRKGTWGYLVLTRKHNLFLLQKGMLRLKVTPLSPSNIFNVSQLETVDLSKLF